MALVLGGHDPPDMEPRRWACLATLGLLLAAACGLPAQTWAAQPNQLLAPAVSPRVGTPATTFAFSVSYEGRDPASAVVAIVAGQTVNLVLVSGTTTSGAFRGESQLPAGIWTVTFRADAERGNDPTADGGTVQVDAPTPIPTPSPAPTLPPAIVSPAPTPLPAGPIASMPATQAPSPAQIDSQPAPEGGASSGSSAAPPAPSSNEALVGAPEGAVFSAVPSAAAGAVSSRLPGAFRATDAVLPILLGGLGVIGLVAAWGLLIGARDRRRRQAEQAALIAAQPSRIPVSHTEQAARAPAIWELDAQLEEETIGTVDFLPQESAEAQDTPAADVAAAPPKRVSPRAARLEAARSKRPASARRSLPDGG